MNTKTNQLRQLLAASEMLTITGCHDALSAHLAEQAGFPAVFMSGFAVSATRLAMPDTGLISFGEMLDQGRNIANAINIPLSGDGDTGFGNAMNIKRKVREYAQAGFACIMLEDLNSALNAAATPGVNRWWIAMKPYYAFERPLKHAIKAPTF